MTRVEIPAYTKLWMLGDRYGEIVKRGIKEDVYFPGEPTPRDWCEIVHVRMDKTGLTARVNLNDCEVL